MRLDGVNVAITGGARGIGEGIARRLASEGARVMIGDLDDAGAAGVAAEILAGGGVAASRRVDVSDRQSTISLVEETARRFGSIDVMFNNAGINIPQHFMDVSEDAYNKVMAVNALGVLIGTQEAARLMIRERRRGKIINTCSIASRQSYPSFVPYCMSKFAVVAVIQGAARSLAAHGITVNGFAPGVVDTPLWEQLDRDLVALGDAAAPGEAMRDFSAGILMGRSATPDDVAGTAAFLASADSDYMTGQVVMIDGGMVLV
jgi:meso-butanediol dehydrogenase / (S,S)-butanediol dehydrogenase / diacetyl reductase